ncbi:hypothetical protein ON010_g7842 [Phytophthora cinnamomi]|nr:hypothetical protein ON010_g7842 [Phytophthora cinnamomi]
MAAKLLCQWHINRNVLVQAQKKTVQVGAQNSAVIEKFIAKFYKTIESETEEEFNSRSAELRKLSCSMGK